MGMGLRKRLAGLRPDIPVFLGTTVTTDHKLEWFGTSRSRLGFLATPNLLLYGTGGVAYGQTKDTYTAAAVGFAAAVATVKDVRAGWTVGGGIRACRPQLQMGWLRLLIAVEPPFRSKGRLQRKRPFVFSGPASASIPE